jgi:hypothetical protein
VEDLHFVAGFGGALNLNPHLHSVLADGLWVAADGSTQRLRFAPLPPPTTAEIERLAIAIAERVTRHVASVWEAEGSGYLDPRLASLVEAFFFSRTPPVATRSSEVQRGVEEEEGAALGGKALCASVQGFSLHAAQAVGAQDREALERLLRYGLRAPFAQERLSVREDGKVIYRLRRPWPNDRGATHLVLDPLDFLRRLAALVSFPYQHQTRYHGVFANRCKLRRLLPPPPRREEENPGIATRCGASAPRDGTAPSAAQVPPQAADRPRRHRTPWAQLLRRVLHVDALSCPKCSRVRVVPMVVLAVLTDPDVVTRILHHLGLPATPPAIAPARRVSGQIPVDPYAPPLQTEIELGPADEGCCIDPPEEAPDPDPSVECLPPIRPPP